MQSPTLYLLQYNIIMLLEREKKRQGIEFVLIIDTSNGIDERQNVVFFSLAKRYCCQAAIDSFLKECTLENDQQIQIPNNRFIKGKLDLACL